MKLWILSLWMLGAIVFLNGNSLFEEANGALEGGDYASAIDSYEDLLSQDGPRVSVLQNLGSAYFREGEVGRAILSFERALVLDPGNADLEANLKLARDEAAVFSVEPRGFGLRISRLLSARSWSWLALVAAIAFPIAVAVRIWRKKSLTNRSTGGRARWAGELVIMLTVVMFALKSVRELEFQSERGLVVEESATVRLSPFESAEERGRLAPGREVTLGQQRNGFFWVEDLGGSLSGWMSMADVEPLIPREIAE